MEVDSTGNNEEKRYPSRKKRKINNAKISNTEVVTSQPAAKRPKRRLAVGKLAGLVNMPVDILFEIFGHLEPYDLLNLARTTKQFRGLLMDKSSRSVWKTTLNKVPDLPSCPSNMREPAWVNLVFDPVCHMCSKTRVRTVEWSLRLRICVKCAKEKIREMNIPILNPWYGEDVSNIPIEFHFSLAKPDDYPIQLLVLSRPGKRGFYEVLLPEYEKVQRQFMDLKSEAQREAYVKERRKFVLEVQEHARLCSAWASRQSDDRQDELQRIKDERYTAIVARLNALGYADDIASIQNPDSLRDHKLVKKPQKLTDRVWFNIQQSLIEFMDRMRIKRLKREHAQLVLQRQISAVAVLRSWKNERLPLTEVMPEGPDFCAFPPVKAILEQSTDVTVNESSFSDILPLIPDLIAQWRKTLDDKIIPLLKRDQKMLARRLMSFFYDMEDEFDFYDDYYDYDDYEGYASQRTTQDTSPPLDDSQCLKKMKLATTVYQCNRCPSDHHLDDSSEESYNPYEIYDHDYPNHTPLMFYPNVLGHLCLTRDPISPWFWYTTTDPAKKLNNYSTERGKWGVGPLRINESQGARVKALVLAAGLDPEAATADDMDNLDVWFVCVFCIVDNSRTDYAYTWRGALEHECLMPCMCTKHNKHDAMWNIKKLSKHEAEGARQAYESLLSSENGNPSDDCSTPSTDQKAWLCTHCRDTQDEISPNTLRLIRLHLERVHDIQNPELNQDYYKDYAAAPSLIKQPIVVDSDTLLFRRAVAVVERCGDIERFTKLN